MNTVLRGFVALLAVLLLGTAAVPAGGHSFQQSNTIAQTTIIGNENGTNYLSPSGTATQGYDRITTDVASSASIAAQQLHSAHDTRTSAQQLQSANTSQRAVVAENQLDRVESRFETLAQQQSRLYQSYADGEISNRKLLRKLVTFRIVANAQVQNYERAAENTDLGIRRDSQLETLSAGLTPEQPVLDRVEQSLTAGDPRVIYLAAAGEGLTLATVTDEEYVRQASVLSERDFQGQDQFKLDQGITIDDEQYATLQGYNEALPRRAELYPWAYDRTEVGPIVAEPLSRIYKFDVNTAQGELTTYFDGATRNVFHENQVGNPAQRAVERVVTNGTAGLNVSVSLTHDSGPSRIEVTDDGAPVEDVVVKIDGTTVGQTTNRGELWAIQPRGAFAVTATVDGETVSVSVP